MADNTAQTVAGIAVIIAAVAGFVWFQSNHISSSDASSYGDECSTWISKNYGDGRTAKVFDSWKKRGNMVFEIGVTQADNPSMASMYLCVVDPSKGTMMKPSAFDQSWSK